MTPAVSARDAGELNRRKVEVRGLLRRALIARGHVCEESGRVNIAGEYLDWRIYEPSVQRKVPLTKEEKQSWLNSAIAKRGWKKVLEPGGFLAATIKADFHSEIRIPESHKRPLETRIAFIVERFETIAAEAAERRKRQDEARQQFQEVRRQRQERVLLQAAEDRKWEAFVELADDWQEAHRLRRFMAQVIALNEAAPDLSGKVADWIDWARDGIDALDPFSGGMEGFLERLFPPEPSEYELNFGEPESA